MKKTNEKGITLIALVITIIVLLILAGVTISTLTGDNGIITRATQAGEETKKATAEEQVELSIIGSIGTDGNIDLGKLNEELKDIDDLTYNSYPIGEDNQIESLPAVIEINGNQIGITGNGESLKVATIDEIKNSIYVEETTLVKDANNKNIILPEGFTIRVDESTTNADNVEEGIVIEDRDGNQYVWIPVDGILGEDGTIEDVAGDEKKILLGRYLCDSEGVPSEYTRTYVQEETMEEHVKSGYQNAIARDIEGFIDSVRKNRGYYIARYEASQNTTTNKAESKYNKVVWGNITQPNASIACQNLYTSVNSDLVNSYVWDTTILFIQKYGTNSNYANEEGKNINTSLQNTGVSGDIQVNICDMAANCEEWSTETWLYPNRPDYSCMLRGGIYYPNASGFTTDNRSTTGVDSNGPNSSFRSILYL